MMKRLHWFCDNGCGSLFRFVVSVLVIFIPAVRTCAQEDLRILTNWVQYSNAPNSLYLHIAGQAYKLLEQRNNAVDRISTLEGWQQRQAWVKKTLAEIVDLPERTPLNAKIVRKIKKDGYTVEHIIYESQPGFYVTSSLFIPSGLKKPAPAVIYCSGHTVDGYRSPVYQHVMLNLVKKGFVVFAFDPLGQGERSEYFNEKTGKSDIGIGTSEHSYTGIQAFITGSSQARYFTWDGIRAIDYLVTRKEVDPKRIGMTGRSGGGTQTAYIAALDERITAAAPENWITSSARLLQSITPQDAEQNLYQNIVKGIDHADLLLARAPKPLLLVTTSRDFFSIQGVLETENEASRFYKAFGKEENFGRSEDDTVHASTRKNREAMYAFFQKSLNNPGNPADEQIQMLSVEEMKVTETGQVLTSLKSETVFSLNSRQAEKLFDGLQSSRNDLENHIKRVLESAKRLSGYIEPVKVDVPVFTGRINRDGYAVEKYFMKGEGEYVLPYLLFVPEKSNGKALIYLNPEGKAAGASAGGEMAWFVKNGITVLAPDLPGVGETGNTSASSPSYSVWYASMLIGRSITGIRAGDVNRLSILLGKRPGINEIYGLARKEMAPVLLHAAA